MTIVSPPPLNTVRALPHVSGHSRRVKAAPTVLTPTVAAMMSASGVFSTKSQPKAFRPGRFIAALAFVLTAATLAIAGDPGAGRHDAPVQVALSEQLLSLGVAELGVAELGDLAPSAGPAAKLGPQDQFEIDRMFRLSGGVR
jgi:hypothetical protein